jgi:hypothetical protein
LFEKAYSYHEWGRMRFHQCINTYWNNENCKAGRKKEREGGRKNIYRA